ncbi:MAG: PASTA domain-containing protein [Actinomycetota bacterium]|nr:PASTA domain-containing protein [Actinomycetota bacterium]
MTTKLLADVGPEGTAHISLKHLDGTPVRQLDPGTYEIEVTDHSGDSSFHLTGPGVDVGTGVEEVVTKTWTVTFTVGQYKFFCDAWPSLMHGTFTVGTITPPPPPPPPKACVVPNVKGKTLQAARKRLVAAHCRVGKVGSAFSGMKTGRVISQSAKAGKHLAHLAKVNLVLSRGHKH